MLNRKRLLFAKGSLKPTLRGIKKITLRKYREGSHDFEKEDVVRGEFFEEGLDILITITAKTELKTFDEMSDTDAREHGFSDAQDMFEAMNLCYKNLKPETMAAIIRFEVYHVDDDPVVSLNNGA